MCVVQCSANLGLLENEKDCIKCKDEQSLIRNKNALHLKKTILMNIT